jgi:hypothetical protein
MRSSHYQTLLALIFLIGQVFITSFISVHAQVTTPEIFTKDSKPYGIPYADWLIKWWQWTATIPKSQHPTVNSTICTTHVDNSVMFFVHKIQGDSHQICKVPAGKSLLLELVTAECDPEDIGGSQDESKLVDCTSEGNNYAAIRVIMDGQVVPGTDQNRVQTKFFNITWSDDNVFDASPGIRKATANGYFILFKPLSVGKHELFIKASVDNPTDVNFNFAYNAKYDIFVN